VQVLTGEHLRDEVLAPAALLAPHLEGGEAYLDWLAGQCASLVGRPMPRVAVHRDLTLWNVLLDGHGGLGVVDWESACQAGWPLTDLFYAAVDGVAATYGYGDRPAAFQACFAPGGAQASLVARWQQRLCDTLAIGPDAAALGWHACWLQHAANELAAASGNAERPFLQIVQWLAQQPQFRGQAGIRTELDRWLPVKTA
jgi:hypothetical protein